MQVYSTGSFSEGPLPCAVHAVYSMTLYASLCTFRTHVVVAFRCSCCVCRTLHDYGLCQSDYRYSTMCYVNVAGVVSVCCRVRSRVGIGAFLLRGKGESLKGERAKWKRRNYRHRVSVRSSDDPAGDGG